MGCGLGFLIRGMGGGIVVLSCCLSEINCGSSVISDKT